MIIFACSVGMTPAIITETLWALASLPEPIIPDRVEVFTTTRGRDLIQAQLFQSGIWLQFKKSLEAKGLIVTNKLKFGNTSEYIHLSTHHPEGDEVPYELIDPKNAGELDSLANHLLSELCRLTENSDSTLIASLSGGRKTMSALFYSAFSMVKRPQDFITHVLCDDDVMSGTTPLFFWPMQGDRYLKTRQGREYDAQTIELNLIQIPCIALRPVIHDLAPNHSFTDHVQRISLSIDPEHLPSLCVPKDGMEIIVDSVKIELSSVAQMALVRALAYAAKEGQRINSREELHAAWCKHLKGSKPNIHDKERLNSELSRLKKCLRGSFEGKRLVNFLPVGHSKPCLSLPAHKITLL